MTAGLKIGSRTKWGKADHVETIAPGIQRVSTPSHGGYKLDRKRNAEVDTRWRRVNGWYEEDCEWAIVWLTFEQTFCDHAPTAHVFVATLEQAHCSARAYYPDEYTTVTGTRVPLEQSHVLRRRKFEAENRNRFVAVAAWGEWHAKVPTGFVGVLARKGGGPSTALVGTHPGLDVDHEQYFLIPKADYEAKGEFGIVIKPEHQPWKDHA